MGISRPRVPWWDAENTNIIQLGAIDVNKTELKYKGEKPYGSGTQDVYKRQDLTDETINQPTI